MRVSYLLMVAAAVICTSAHAASAATNTEQTAMISSRETSATSRFLRKHDEARAAEEQDDDDEERALNLETIVNWFKSFGSEKMDDLAPKLKSEMKNVNKLDDVVDTKKLDDVTDLKKLDGAKTEMSAEEMAKTLVEAFKDWKSKKVSVQKAAQEMRNSGVKDEAAIQEMMAWYSVFVQYVK